MSIFDEVDSLVESEMMDEWKRDNAADEATREALAVLNEHYPEFNKSAGACGDRLAYSLRKLITDSIEQAQGED